MIAMAKKGNDKKKKKKIDSHSFAPKPDEATGPFPESVLLREVFPFFSSSFFVDGFRLAIDYCDEIRLDF